MADDTTRDSHPAAADTEDRPFRVDPNLPPQVKAPLAALKGERPESPAWFKAALAQEPERSMVPVNGANIELLTWGERGNPGLILVHGNGAHADWWSFIAPFFAKDYRVAALSFSGMGASDWRDTYDFETFAEEIWACAKAAGLYEAATPPVYIGHSFGGSQVFFSAALHPERMSACLLVDTGFGGPPTPAQMDQWRKEAEARGEDPSTWRSPMERKGPNKVYATQVEALARFRLMPPQGAGTLYTVDHIARHGMKRSPLPDGSGEGWIWTFDPEIWGKLDRSGMMQTPPTPTVPMAHIYGENSEIIRRHGMMLNGRSVLPEGAPQIVIPESEHHIMIDQPLALVAAMRAVLAMWAA